MTRSLEEVQTAFTRMCFDRTPKEADLAVLHDDRERWLMYRRMVRSRLFGIARQGLPKSASVIGKEKFDAAVTSYLEEHGPTTRFLRRVVFELVEHATPAWQADEELPEHALDLVRYEATKWEVGALEWESREASELDFEMTAVMNPTVRTVDVTYRVDKDAKNPKKLDETHVLLIYRKPAGRRVFTYVLNAMGGRLFRAWEKEVTCADGVREVLAATKRQPDEKFIDGMAGVLSDLVEQRVVLGSVP